MDEHLERRVEALEYVLELLIAELRRDRATLLRSAADTLQRRVTAEANRASADPPPDDRFLALTRTVGLLRTETAETPAALLASLFDD